MSSINPDQLEFEWMEKLSENPSVDRREGFRDAVREESWNNSYETESESWEEYARGWDEGKKFLEKRTGKQAIREAFLDLLTLELMHTPENNYSEEELGEDVPFLTESYLYALVGKQDARTILSRFRNLMEACGFDRRELERQAARMED